MIGDNSCEPNEQDCEECMRDYNEKMKGDR